MNDSSYDQLKRKLQELHASGAISGRLTDEQRVDWAYGNTKLENDAITREMVEFVVLMKNRRLDEVRKSTCLHDACSSCHGSGKRLDGLGSCVHMISCPCRKCSPGSM